MSQSPWNPKFRNTRHSTFKAKVREELICAICLDFLTEPKVLGCAHSFCLECLDKTCKSQFRYGSGVKPGELECPSCRQVSRLPPSGKVTDLSTNHTLKRLVSVVSIDDKKATRQLISSRSSSVNLTQAQTCSQHRRKMEYYCLTCNQLVCPKCISGTHKRHQFEDIEKILPSQVQALRSLIQPACEVASRAEGMLDQLYKLKENISANSSTSRTAIEGYFTSIRKALDQRESALKATVQKYSDVKMSRLDSQYQLLQKHHDSILAKVTELEGLIDDNNIVNLFSKKQAISDEIESQEQAVLALGDLLTESSSEGSLMFKEGQSLASFSELGSLNEKQQKPNTPFVTLRRVVVSEEEDPYLDVPLKFEDEQNIPSQKQVRVDETKSSIEYEPEEKPPRTPTPDAPQPVRPPVPKRRGPDIRPRSRRLTPSTANKPSSPERKPYVNLPSRAPAPILPSDSSEEDYESMDDLPLPKPRTKPPALPSNHPSKVPPKPLPKPRRRSESVLPLPPRRAFPLKKRSLTLPTTEECDLSPPSCSFSPPPSPRLQSVLRQPLRIIDNRMLSSPSHNETVYPNGVCRSGENIVITDVYNHCLRVITNEGSFVEKIGCEGRSGGQFKEPTAIAIDTAGNMFVSERDNPRVQKFNAQRRYLTKFGQKTLLGSQLGDPMGIAVTTNDAILITDWERNDILIFSNSGKMFGSVGQENNLLRFPAGLTLNHRDNILVADRGNHCVWELNISGDVVRKIGSRGTRPGQLYFPYGVIVSDNGTIIVSESGNNRVSLFTEAGEFIECFGGKGSEPGMFDHPRYLCLDSQGHLVVVDQMNKRLQIFSL